MKREAGSELDLPIDPSASASPIVHNQSVLKAVGLIGCFVGQPGGKTLTELAKQMGMNISTAYRMLQTLTATGVLRRNEGDERYYVGPMLLGLAGAIFSDGGFDVVLSILTDVVDQVNESACIALRSDDCAAILLSVGSRQPLRFQHRAGSRIPIHCSAAGKALLAFSGRDGRDVVAELGPLRAMTVRSVVRQDILVGELEAARQSGYALSNEEHNLGVRSVGVPIRRDNQPSRLAISVQGPVSRMDAAAIARIVEVSQQAAERIADLPLNERLRVPP